MSEKKTAIERLEEMLDQKDAEIGELQSWKDEHEADEESDRWAWARFSKSDEREGLPVPRLEIRWRRIDDWHCDAHYNLVYRHFLGDVIVVPFGVTKCNGGGSNGYQPVRNGEVETPFRDGAHIAHDMRHMNLPGFAIFEGTITTLKARKEPAPYERESHRTSHTEGK